MSGLMSLLMLLFLFTMLEAARCFLSGAGSGFFSTGLFCEKLLESVEEIGFNQQVIDNVASDERRKKNRACIVWIHYKLHAKGPAE